MRAISLLVLVPFASGCFAIADLDRFEKRQDFTAHLLGFAGFAGERVEIRIVNESDVGDFVVEGRAVLDPMVDDHYLAMPRALRDEPYGVDVFVDMDRNGDYDLGEPLWRKTLGPDGKLHLEATEPQTAIMDPPTRTDATGFLMHFHGMSVHTADVQRLELVVIDRTDQKSVGYFFIPDINDDSFDVAIPGIILPDHEYDIDYYADANKNGHYDDPGLDSDHTWREHGVGTDDDPGLVIDFVHHAMFTPVPESFPAPP